MKSSDLIHDGEIVLEGTIISSGYEEYYDSGIITGSLVRGALAEFVADVVVRVNSPGGDPTEGEAIRVMLAEHDGQVTVKVAGDAASAASLMIMGADRIEMSEGSIMMIHDPSSITFGDADDHRRRAEMLDVLADTYASVYARRSGKSTKAVRKMMKDETWMGPARAVAEGFADAVSGNAPADEMVVSAEMLAGAQVRHVAALRMLDSTPKPSAAPAAAAPPTAAGGLSPATTATTQEDAMSKPTTPAVAVQVPPANPAPAAPATMVAPPAAPSGEDLVQSERTRVRAIREMAKPFLVSGQLTQDDVDALIDDGTSSTDAGQKFMTKMAAAQPPAPRSTPATITRDEGETKVEGMIGALMGKADGPAADFGGLRLKSLAMHLAGPKRGFNEASAIRSGMMSTTMMGGAYGVSDFAYITTEVMNRTLMAEYQRRTADWSVVTGTPLTASDFRELHAVRFGGDFQLKKVLENGEYQEATLADEAEGLKVERRGRTINITFEAIINDDMGAFARIPREFAMAARVMEASMVWSLIRSNATLKSDGLALFHATHKNLAGSGAVLSPTAVGAARKAMWEQTAFGAKDKDDFIMAVADRLVVPPAIELAAMQFVAPITPATDANANPFKSLLTPLAVPHLGAAAGGSDTAWYLFSSDLPPISHAYLDGYQAPTVQTIEGMNSDKVTMNARHIFGAAATEFRGLYKNPGA